MIKDFIKYQKAYFLFWIIIVLFFPLIHSLYGYPLESILYSCLIFTFFFLCWLLYRYYHFREKMNHLSSLLPSITSDTIDLPRADNRVEVIYHDIILSLYKLLHENLAEMEKRHLDQMEYYTMWVHQIKTPISALRLLLQVRPSQDALLMNQDLFKIEQYVEMALQYVKLNQLSADFIIKDYEMKNIINSSVKKYAELFIYKKLYVKIEQINLKVKTDSKWIAFIIEQLLSNGIKYSYEGGITISQNANTLIIADTGIGIRSEDMERIFEKGYTGYNGRLDKKASGIGLYMAKKVADTLAIKIRIESKVGKGTKAILIFPEEINDLYE